MKPIKNILFLAGLCAAILLAVGCEKGENSGKRLDVDNINVVNCEWKAVAEMSLNDNSLKERLDSIFSEKNPLLTKINGDTLLFVINNEQDFSEICKKNNIGLSIDFEKQSIIWGRILTSSISDKITSQQLSECITLPNNYKYDIYKEKCTECWAALGFLYYWAVYPQKIEKDNILLTIK